MLFSTKLFLILWAEAERLAADTSVCEVEHAGIFSVFFSVSVEILLFGGFLLGTLELL